MLSYMMALIFWVNSTALAHGAWMRRHSDAPGALVEVIDVHPDEFYEHMLQGWARGYPNGFVEVGIVTANGFAGCFGQQNATGFLEQEEFVEEPEDADEVPEPVPVLAAAREETDEVPEPVPVHSPATPERLWHRKGWTEHARLSCPDTTKLREAAAKAADQLHGCRLGHLRNTTAEGRKAVDAPCKNCAGCTRQRCFSFLPPRGTGRLVLVVEKKGECCPTSPSNARILDRAKEYAQRMSPVKARDQMERDKVPLKERPDLKQLQNARTRKPEEPRIPVVAGRVTVRWNACIGEMKDWLKKDHNPIFLLNMVDTKTGQQTPVVTEKNLRIPFTHGVSEALLAEHRLEWLLMDWTWKTNYHGMLVGAVGPVGLHVDEATGLPTMRFLPVVFMASETEDDEASELLLQAYFEIADRLGISTTHAVMDCRCMGAAAPLCEARGIRLRRCLQRVKGNVADEGKKMLDKGSGVKRMKNTALIHPIKNFMEFSAGLPDSGAGGEGESDLEFNVLWTEIFDRMREDGEESFQWGESAMADYLLTNIFTVRPDGTITAPWRCGLGQAPPGLTTYATSTIERSWRTLKGACCAGGPKSLPELIDGIGAMMTSRKDTGFW
ncbi:unnamed protein product, partial [Prorocentrum cordatum]